jgi:hypothetical protein
VPAAFLSAAWLEEMNGRLAVAATAVDLEPPSSPLIVVFDVVDGPMDLPHAFTLSVSGGTAQLAAGDHLGADVVVRLAFADAAALADGSLTSDRALRDGRLKVRGDTGALGRAGAWLVAAQARGTAY